MDTAPTAEALNAQNEIFCLLVQFTLHVFKTFNY
jgi:hypothetical protein